MSPPISPPISPPPDDASIERLALGVIDRTLSKADWTHAGHFAVALWLLRHRRDLTAPDAIRGLITGYNAATGTANTDASGYHHTITLASMRAAADHLDRCEPDTSLQSALGTLLASRLGRADWPLAHWERATLFGTAARRAWVEPDRAPLPF